MPAKKAAVALANKTARIAWALLAKGGTYRQPKLPAVAREARNGPVRCDILGSPQRYLGFSADRPIALVGA